MRVSSAICVCLCVGLAFACVPEPLAVDDIPQLKPKIVVSTQVSSNQSVAILLTKSVGALDANEDTDPEELIRQIAIDDARVSMQHAGTRYDFFALGNGVYSSGQVPLVPGDEYTLTVESLSMGLVTSTTMVNEIVPFDFVQANIFDSGYDTLAEVSYGFKDPPGKNFYMFNVQRLTGEFDSEDILNPEIFIDLIDDSEIVNGLYQNRKRVEARRDFEPGDTVAIVLSNISEEYFKFMKVRADARFNFAEFLGEPANYPTNINGGLGFFNLHIPDVRILRLE
ncbi:MAG: DUF4249 domain-containing protein [Cyclobacteriaceae bacterium]|nr:DUF4249 domain-containing protein [Cyclobacteriaceae bacterium]